MSILEETTYFFNSSNNGEKKLRIINNGFKLDDWLSAMLHRSPRYYHIFYEQLV